MNIGIESPFFNSEIVYKWAIRSSPRVCACRWGKTTHGHQFQSEVVLVHERNDQQGAWGSSCLSRNWIWMTHDGSWWFMMVHESKVIDRPSLWVVLTHNDTYVTHCYPSPVVMVSCEPCFRCAQAYADKWGYRFTLAKPEAMLSSHVSQCERLCRYLMLEKFFFCPWTCLPFCWELSIDPHILNDIDTISTWLHFFHWCMGCTNCMTDLPLFIFVYCNMYTIPYWYTLIGKVEQNKEGELPTSSLQSWWIVYSTLAMTAKRQWLIRCW